MTGYSTGRSVAHEPGRFPIRMPPPWCILAATLVMVVAFLPFRAWLLDSWQKRVIAQFLAYARTGEIAKCRAMLAEDHSAEWTLDEFALRRVADEGPLVTEPTSLCDNLIGKQQFRPQAVPFQNDYSLTVAWGRITLGSAFWFQYFPPGPPEIKLKRQVPALEEYRLRQETGADSDIDL